MKKTRHLKNFFIAVAAMIVLGFGIKSISGGAGISKNNDCAGVVVTKNYCHQVYELVARDHDNVIPNLCPLNKCAAFSTDDFIRVAKTLGTTSLETNILFNRLDEARPYTYRELMFILDEVGSIDGRIIQLLSRRATKTEYIDYLLTILSPDTDGYEEVLFRGMELSVLEDSFGYEQRYDYLVHLFKNSTYHFSWLEKAYLNDQFLYEVAHTYPIAYEDAIKTVYNLGKVCATPEKRQALLQQFPQEKERIHRYCADQIVSEAWAQLPNPDIRIEAKYVENEALRIPLTIPKTGGDILFIVGGIDWMKAIVTVIAKDTSFLIDYPITSKTPFFVIPSLDQLIEVELRIKLEDNYPAWPGSRSGKLTIETQSYPKLLGIGKRSLVRSYDQQRLTCRTARYIYNGRGKEADLELIFGSSLFEAIVFCSDTEQREEIKDIVIQRLLDLETYHLHRSVVHNIRETLLDNFGG